jgi:glycosyltransferase involved in cell wall biosynthesis
MKFIQVIHQFLPDYVGGIELFVKNVSTSLVNAGHDVLIFSGDGDVVSDIHRKEEIIDDLKLVKVLNKIGTSPKGRNFLRTFKNPLVLKEFDKVIKTFRPDLIHVHHTVYLSGDIITSAKKKGIPVIATMHDFWFLCHKLHLIDWRGNQCEGPHGGLKCAMCFGMDRQNSVFLKNPLVYVIPLIYRTLYQRRLLELTDLLLVPSKLAIEILGRHLHSGAKIMHLPYFIPYHPSALDQNRPTPRIRFGYMGSIKPHKGLHILIDAFNELVDENVSLEIHGPITTDDTYGAELMKRRRHRNVSFKGPYNNRNIGGLVELIEDGKNGFLFEHGNPASLLTVIRSILAHPTSLSNLNSEVSKEQKMEYGFEKLTEVYQTLF